MSVIRIIGIVLLAVGVSLLLFGYNASQSLDERVVEGITGRFSSQTMWFVNGGIASVVGGGALAIWGSRRSTSL